MQAWIKRFCPQTLDGLILGLTWLVYRHIFLSPKPIMNHIGYLQLPVMFQFFPMICPLPRAGFSSWWFLDERRTRIHHPWPDFAADSGCSCRRLEGWHFKKSFILGSSVLYTWRFPKIGVSLFFPWNKPCSYWGTPVHGNLHIQSDCSATHGTKSPWVGSGCKSP